MQHTTTLETTIPKIGELGCLNGREFQVSKVDKTNKSIILTTASCYIVYKSPGVQSIENEIVFSFDEFVLRCHGRGKIVMGD